MFTFRALIVMCALVVAVSRLMVVLMSLACDMSSSPVSSAL